MVGPVPWTILGIHSPHGLLTMNQIRWRDIAVWSAVCCGTALALSEILLGGAVAGELAVYLFLIFTPGELLLESLLIKYRKRPLSILATTLYANLVGLGLAEMTGWTLARSDFFSIPLFAILEWLIVVGVLLYCWGDIRVALRCPPSNLIEFRQNDGVYLALLTTLGVLNIAPLLLLFNKGLFIGADTPSYVDIGWRIYLTGGWPNLGQVLWPYASPTYVAPGSPVIYALFSAPVGHYSPEIATPLSLFALVLTPIAVYLLICRFTGSNILRYGLPIVWVLAASTPSAFFNNNLIISVAAGSHPDVVLLQPILVTTLVLLVDLLRGRSNQWFEVALLSVFVAGSVLLSQLMVIVLLPTLIFFGAEILQRRGSRWCFPRLALVSIPLIIAWPLYLLPSLLAGASPGVSHQSILSIQEWEVIPSLLLTNDGVPLGFLLLLILLGLSLVVSQGPIYRNVRKFLSTTRGLTQFILLTFTFLYLAFSGVGNDFLGINYARFLPFASLFTLPPLAVLLDRLLHLDLKQAPGFVRPSPHRAQLVALFPPLFIVVLLVAAGFGGLQQNIEQESELASPSTVMSPEILNASDWIRANVPATAPIAVDGNGGNNEAVAPLGPFSGHPMIKRPRNLLASVLSLPYPQNVSYELVNREMTDPSAESTALSVGAGIDYYVFQTGYSDRQIAAFSDLPYFRLAFSNSQISIFEYKNSPAVGFVPATDYCASSSSIASVFSLKAYSYAASSPPFPKTPNWVTSTNNTVTGPLVLKYCLDSATAGTYRLFVNRFVEQTSENVNISVNGVATGTIYFSTLGLSMGTPLEISVPTGPFSLTLTMDDTVGAMDPIDYLIIS